MKNIGLLLLAVLFCGCARQLSVEEQVRQQKICTDAKLYPSPKKGGWLGMSVVGFECYGEGNYMADKAMAIKRCNSQGGISIISSWDGRLLSCQFKEAHNAR